MPYHKAQKPDISVNQAFETLYLERDKKYFDIGIVHDIKCSGFPLDCQTLDWKDLTERYLYDIVLYTI